MVRLLRRLLLAADTAEGMSRENLKLFSVRASVFLRFSRIIKAHGMNEEGYSAAVKLVSQTYVEQGRNAHRTQQNFVRELFEKLRYRNHFPCHASRGCIHTQRKLSEDGWPDNRIEMLLEELSLMGSNNFPGMASHVGT